MPPQNQKTKVMPTQSSNSLTQLISEPVIRSKPIGISIFGVCIKFKTQSSRKALHQGLVLLMTFIAYAAFHMGRRPLSVVKNVLNRDCSRLKPKNLTSSILDEVAATAATLIVSRDHYPDYQAHIGNQAILSHQTHQQPALTSLNDYDYTLDRPDISTNTLFTTQQPYHPVNYALQTSTSLRPWTLNGLSPDARLSSAVLVKDTSCDWAPFNDDATANQLLAVLDTSFLLSYALFMFISGIIAERTNLRHFISYGSIVSGLGLIAFGMSYSLDIHSMTYFIVIQIISGAAQTTGWPVVVTCVSNWFDRSKLGTIYGLWNSHTNLGNILGATIAGFFVEQDWGLSFIVPGVLMIIVGVLLFLFLVPTPEDVELEMVMKTNVVDKIENDNNRTHADFSEQGVVVAQAFGGSGDEQQNRDAKEQTPKLQQQQHSSGLRQLDGHHNDRTAPATGIRTNVVEPIPSATSDETMLAPANKQHQKPISFMKALRIPGVIEYSFCLFFSKLVSYTFLYWLPRYITSSTTFNSKDSAYLSTPFDVGGIAGSILAGWLSDRFKVNGIICNIMLLLAIPSMFVYQQFGAYSSWHNILLQLLVGSLVNGPYCLITTAVSADLGNRIKDGRAMATVSAIIDGMGSVGAVLGPLFAGFVSSNDWRSVFLMLMIADVLAALCIIRVTVQDVRAKFLSKNSRHDLHSITASEQA